MYEPVLPTEEGSYLELETGPLEIEDEIGETTPAASETVEMIAVDYTPVIYEVGNGLAAVQLFSAFLIVGVLIVFKILEVKR